MKPVVVMKWFGPPEPLLLLDVLPDGRALVVQVGGRLELLPVKDLQVDRPTLDFPLGYNFSRVQVEGES